MKKNPIKEMTDLGLSTGLSAVALGAFPTNAVTPQVLTGMAKFSTAFPTVGKLAGVGMTVGAAKKLFKTTKKLKL